MVREYNTLLCQTLSGLCDNFNVFHIEWVFVGHVCGCRLLLDQSLSSHGGKFKALNEYQNYAGFRVDEQVRD